MGFRNLLSRPGCSSYFRRAKPGSPREWSAGNHSFGKARRFNEAWNVGRIDGHEGFLESRGNILDAQDGTARSMLEWADKARLGSRETAIRICGIQSQCGSPGV